MPSKQPRLNLTITEEQRALLFELAELEGGTASGFVRKLVDQVTPLLRVSVPLLRTAAQEHQITVEQGRQRIKEALEELSHTGLLDQLDFDDLMQGRRAVTAGNAASGSERGPEERPAVMQGPAK